MSLVPSYDHNSSNSSSDEDELQLKKLDDEETLDRSKDLLRLTAPEINEAYTLARRQENSLFFGDVEETSSEDDEDDNNSNKPSTSFDSNCAYSNQRLPSAISLLNDVDENDSNVSSKINDSSSSSVFHNPFLQAERQYFDVLEKHVKMTENQLAPDRKLKKRSVVCAMFRKGRCKFSAEQCRFSHVVGEHLLNQLGVPTSSTMPVEPQPSTVVYSGNAVRYNEREEIVMKKRDDQEDINVVYGIKKRQRTGVCDSLKPPKKAAQLFDKLRVDEAPWLFDGGKS